MLHYIFFTKPQSSDELMRAQSQLWSHIFNYVDSLSLKCAVELGIPDAIHSHGKPIALSDLLSALSIPPAKEPHMRRLMRMLSHSGIFAPSGEDVYSLTPLSALLVKNNNNVNLSSFVVSQIHPVIMNPFQSASAWFKSNDDEATPCSIEHGCGIWEVMRRDPEYNTAFNDAMASDSRMLVDVLLKDCRHVFEGIESLVDVGGGTGTVAMAIAEAFPDVKCSVLELPQVVNTVKEKGAVEFIAGDMFDYIPPADAIFLKWILHDWNDEECVKILKRCKETMLTKNSDGKVIIIDQVTDFNNSFMKVNTSRLYFDILLMVVFGGAERDEREWCKIFTAAGFNHYKITPALGLRSVIEVYP